MVHYIAQQIATAERARSSAKAAAEVRCFESILKLWQHRHALPNDRSPFKDFAPLLETLRRLNPENHESVYIGWEHAHQDKTQDEATETGLDVSQAWLRAALNVDRAARVLIEPMLQRAAASVVAPETHAWIEGALNTSEEDDVAILLNLIDHTAVTEQPHADLSSSDKMMKADRSLALQRQAIETRLQYLDEFIRLGSILRQAFVAELNDSQSPEPAEQSRLSLYSVSQV